MGAFRLAWIVLTAGGTAAAWPVHTQAQQAASATPPTAAAQPSDEEIIVTLRANGVALGEFVLLRTAGGDFWISEQDFPRLKLQPLEQARRQFQGLPYFSLAALGAANTAFDAAQLAVSLDFPARSLEGTRIDLSNRPPPLPITKPQNSGILNYRAAFRQSGDEAIQLRLTTELNVRVGEVLLRQRAKYDSGMEKQFTRGITQLIWDDRSAGTRLVAGDVLTSGGPFGTTFPGAGISLSRLYAITPDIIRQPSPVLQVSALTPSSVEVAVDGSTVYRTEVGPGPVALDNLFYNGGARTVRVTVTDATGRRQVVEQPFLFTDSVLARGLHEYNYFLGRRSELGPDDSWRYREGAWQAFHRYGVTDSLTVQAGGEGSREFTSGGFGASVRNDVLGLMSLDALASIDRTAGSGRVQGWAARYTYLAPNVSLFAGHRRFDDGFRTFGTLPGTPALLSETRLGASTRLFPASTLAGDLVRARDTAGDRATYGVRFSTHLNRQISLNAEYQSIRTGDERDWAFNLYLRMDLGRQQWSSSSLRVARDSRTADLETGKQLAQGEGIGYRAGVNASSVAGQDSAFAYGSANWNLRPVTLEFNGTSQLRGGRSHYVEAAVSGAVVGVDGYLGMTRVVSDGFALARLGVPQPGVDIFLNNQVQGQTDAQGDLLIPQVGAYGRQDVSLNDKQLPMQYNLATKRVTIAPPFKSGTVVEFGGRKLRAVTGLAWHAKGGARKAIASRAWSLASGGERLTIETAPSGDFYLEDAAPGLYQGTIELDGQAYSCRMTVPDFADAVYEVQEGIICE